VADRSRAGLVAPVRGYRSGDQPSTLERHVRGRCRRAAARWRRSSITGVTPPRTYRLLVELPEKREGVGARSAPVAIYTCARPAPPPPPPGDRCPWSEIDFAEKLDYSGGPA